MAHVLLDRAKVVATSMSGNTANYALTNSPPTGFVDFTGVGDGNTTYYTAADDAGNWEVGIGTFASSGEVLTRTDANVIKSTNSNNRVSWPSSSTPTVFITQPADKAVYLDGDGDVTLTSTDAGSGEDPNLIFYRNSSSPADWDELGTINFRGRNDNSQDVEYAQINAVIEDMTDGTENGRISFETMLSGTLTQTMYMDSWGHLHFMGDNAKLVWNNQNGTTNDANLTWNDLTATRNVYLPDADGTILVQDSNDDVIITSTDAGAGDDPSLILYRNSSSPADSDDLGEIIFRGRNDNSQDVDYGKIWADAGDVSDGTEDGKVKIDVMKAGTLTNVMDFKGTGKTTFNTNDVMLSTGLSLYFEGATANTNEVQLTVTDPTADRVITLPDVTGTVLVTGAQTGITTDYNTARKVGRDADNLIDFTTDNQVTFRVSAGDGVVFKASGEIEATSLDISGDADIDGTLEADAITVNGSTLASVIADEATALAIALG